MGPVKSSISFKRINLHFFLFNSLSCFTVLKVKVSFETIDNGKRVRESWNHYWGKRQLGSNQIIILGRLGVNVTRKRSQKEVLHLVHADSAQCQLVRRRPESVMLSQQE